jgi:hypothetical protein
LFQGSLIAWLIGIPFVILIILTNEDRRISLLLIQESKITDGNTLLSQLKYITNLVSDQGCLIKYFFYIRLAFDHNASILLDGFTEIHREGCILEDCPLKMRYFKNAALFKLFQGNDEALNEKLSIIYQLIYKMYYDGIKK